MRKDQSPTARAARSRKSKGASSSGPRKSHARQTWVEEFLEASKLNRTELARQAKVHLTAIYTWERGEYKPSAETCIQLADLAARKHLDKYVEKFAGWAGLSDEACEVLTDALLIKRQRRAVDNVVVRSLDSDEKLEFPPWIVKKVATLRFVRLSQSVGKTFQSGDILLLDTMTTDMRELEGCLVATSGTFVGFVREEDLSVEEFSLRIFSLEQPGEGGTRIMLGEERSGRTSITREILGRVVAWTRSEAKQQ